MPALLRTVVTLSADQASGVAPALAANMNRTTLVVGNSTATDGRLDIASPGTGEGMPFGAGAILGFGGEGGRPYSGGPACPTQAIYVAGFTASDVITFWEG